MNRGYSLDRGKGQRKRQPRRAECPTCHKRGLGIFKVEPSPTGAVITRTCRYCQHIQFKTYLKNVQTEATLGADKGAARFSEYVITNYPPKKKPVCPACNGIGYVKTPGNRWPPDQCPRCAGKAT
jgi:hypothetical protein